MTYRDLVRLLTKILGLIIIASTLIQFTFAFPVWVIGTSNFQWSNVLAFYIIPSLVGLLVGLAFLRADERIADVFIFEPSAIKSTHGINYQRIETILYSLLGLYIAADALPGLLTILTEAVVSSLTQKELPPAQLQYIARHSGSLLVGICLILGSNGLAIWRHKFLNLRHAVQTWDAKD